MTPDGEGGHFRLYGGEGKGGGAPRTNIGGWDPGSHGGYLFCIWYRLITGLFRYSCCCYNSNQSMALITSSHTIEIVRRPKGPEGMVNCVPVAPQGVWL
jgi:hypothetical protein